MGGLGQLIRSQLGVVRLSERTIAILMGMFEVSKLSMKRGSGARGLRAILEDLLLDVMYELPDQTLLERCVIDDKVVRKIYPPILHFKEEKKIA